MDMNIKWFRSVMGLSKKYPVKFKHLGRFMFQLMCVPKDHRAYIILKLTEACDNAKEKDNLVIVSLKEVPDRPPNDLLKYIVEIETMCRFCGTEIKETCNLHNGKMYILCDLCRDRMYEEIQDQLGEIETDD